MDCQIEISKGAGIQPIKAAKKTIPETSIGNIWFVVISPGLLLIAKPTASNVDSTKITITNFIKLSSNLYFPTVRITIQIIKMNYIIGDIGNTSTRICLLNKSKILKSIVTDTNKIFLKGYIKKMIHDRK